LVGLPLAVVVSSPLARCRQTLELALPGRTPVIDEDLTECGYGEWESQPLKALMKQPLWRVVQEHPAGATFPGPGGESMAAMSARAVAAVRRIDEEVTREHGSDALWLACSHADIIKAIVADALGLHLDLFQRIAVDPASLAVLRYTATRPFLLRLNDTGGSLVGLAAPSKSRRRRSRPADSDAIVGGGSGSAAEAPAG
jgi:probable phosphomutase (TIGR03848 family)